jgi:hypothetical protein
MQQNDPKHLTVLETRSRPHRPVSGIKRDLFAPGHPSAIPGHPAHPPHRVISFKVSLPQKVWRNPRTFSNPGWRHSQPVSQNSKPRIAVSRRHAKQLYDDSNSCYLWSQLLGRADRVHGADRGRKSNGQVQQKIQVEAGAVVLVSSGRPSRRRAKCGRESQAFGRP